MTNRIEGESMKSEQSYKKKSKIQSYGLHFHQNNLKISQPSINKQKL